MTGIVVGMADLRDALAAVPHTALGDARAARKIWDHVMTRDGEA